MLTVKLNAKKKSKNQQITPLEKICITFKKNQKNNYFYDILSWTEKKTQASELTWKLSICKLFAKRESFAINESRNQLLNRAPAPSIAALSYRQDVARVNSRVQSSVAFFLNGPFSFRN